MKIKTSELTGPALDWAVAKCEGYDLTTNWPYRQIPEYSTRWSQGGPIIDREDLHWGFGSLKDGVRTVVASKRGHMQKPMLGPTPLIAAMRCLVSAKLGDEVEIPEEQK